MLTSLAVIGLTGQGDAKEVYGCSSKDHGRLRIVSDNSVCMKSEEPIPLMEALNEIEEHCFEVVMEDGTLLGIAKLEISHIVDGHYIVRGKAYYDDLQVIQGSAEIDGDNILLTATHTSKGNTNLSIGASHILIDRTTFNGTSEVVMHNLNYSDMSISRDYETAFLTNIPCPDQNILFRQKNYTVIMP